MDKSKKLIKIISSLIIFGIAALFVVAIGGHFDKGKPQSKPQSIMLYFIDGETKELKGESRNIKNGDNTQIVKTVLEELKKGPSNKNFLPTIPENVSILEADITEDFITVDLSENYYYLQSSEELFLRASLVFSLTELEFINAVKLTVLGDDIKKSDGEPMGYISRDDIVINSNISPEPENILTVTLYFTDENAVEFIAEEREVTVNPNQPIEKYIVEELIKGPLTEGLIATIPPETKILDISTTKDGICYLDLNRDFLNKLSGGSASENFAIYSIVNSLTEINDIKKVQFLIEGENPEGFEEHIDLTKPLEKLN